MDEKRKGEIAVAIEKYRLIENGVRLRDLKRNSGRIVKSTGIPIEELMEFTEILVREIVDETFSKK